jgi:hypothetical protein
MTGMSLVRRTSIDMFAGFLGHSHKIEQTVEGLGELR